MISTSQNSNSSEIEYIHTRVKTILTSEEALYQSIQYIENDKKRILITAIKLDIKEGSDIFTTYCNGDYSESFPHKEIIFACDQITFDAACHFPSCDIKIFCRQLIFTEKAQIKTAGKNSFTKSPSQKDGRNGNNGGDVTLHCLEIKMPTNLNIPCIVTNGDDGQDPKPGQDGKNGKNCTLNDDKTITNLESFSDFTRYLLKTNAINKWQFNEYFRNLSDKKFNPFDKVYSGYTMRSIKLYPSKSYPNQYFNKGDNKKPTDGTDAVPPGKAGDGGSSGSLTFNTFSDSHLKIVQAYEHNTGTPGETAPTAQGGKAGKPMYTMSVYFEYKHNSDEVLVEKKDWLTTKNGKNAFGEPGKQGNQGKVIKLGKEHYWIHPALADVFIKWAKDQYIQGATDINELKHLLKVYYNSINQFTESELQESQEWREGRYILFSSAQNELKNMLSYMERGVDYFGNPVGFMPTFSVYGAKSIYKQILDDSLYTIIVTQAINESYEKVTDQKKLIFSFIDKLNASIEETKEVMNESSKKLNDLNNEVEELNNKRKEKQDELNERKKIVRKKAKGEEKKIRLIDTIFDGVSLACKVIPYGQPALGIVGGGASDIFKDIVDNNLDPTKKDIPIDWNKGNRLKDFYSAYKIYLENNEKTYEDENTREKLINDLKKLSDNKDIREGSLTDAQKEEIFKQKSNIKNQILILDKKNSLIEKGLANGMAIFNDLKVDKKRINLLFEKLLKEDEKSQSLIQKIKVLNDKVAKLYLKIESEHKSISKGQSFILSSINKISNLVTTQIDESKEFNKGIVDTLNSFKHTAYERIYYFQYLLIKSYEATFLKPFNKSFASESFIKELNKMLHKKESISLLDNVDEIKKALKEMILNHVKFDKEDYHNAWNADTIGQDTKFKLRISQTIDGIINPYLKVINQNIAKLSNANERTSASVIFPLSFFRDADTLSIYRESKLFEINLSKIYFSFCDLEGNQIKNSKGDLLIDTRMENKSGDSDTIDSGGDKFLFEQGVIVFKLQAPSEGIIRIPNKKIAFRPENEWIWSWEYDLQEGKKPDDKKLIIGKSSIDGIIADWEEAKTIDKTKLLAPIPLEGDYSLTFNCPTFEIIQTTRSNEVIKHIVRPQINKLEFSIGFYGKMN